MWSLSEVDLSSVTPKAVREEVERRFGLEEGDLGSFRKQIIQEIGEAAATWPENHFEYEDGADDGDASAGRSGSSGRNEKKD